MSLENIADDEPKYRGNEGPHRVSVNFLAPLSLHYSVKHDSEDLERLWREDYERELGGFSDEVLRDAVRRIYRKRNYSNFPMIADCVEACEEVLESRLAKGPEAYSHLARDYPEWSRERIRAANRMLASGIGKKAAAEGWIIGLWDFCRNKNRLPQQHEVPKIVASSREAWRVMKEIDQSNPMAPILNKTAAMLRDRRKDLTAIVEGKFNTTKEAAEARKQ